MQVKILKATGRRVELKTPFKVEEFLVDHTMHFSLEVMINDTLIYSPLSQLPLFYQGQDLTGYINKNYHFDLDKLEFSEELPTNILFSLELSILKYIATQEATYKNKAVLGYTTSPKALINSLSTNTTKGPSDQDVIKLKIGRQTESDESAYIKKLIHSGKTLRLDGNRMLTPSSLENILQDVDQNFIEYIEEPFPKIQDWNEFKFKNSFQLALDESLIDCINTQLPKNTGAFIIKPTLIFGLFKTLEILEDPRYKDIKKVISSSFEDEETLNALIHISQRQSSPTCHGLGTMPLLKTQTTHLKQDGSFLQGCPINLF